MAEEHKKLTPDELAELQRSSGLGPGNRTTHAVFRGLNPLATIEQLPGNTDQQGLIFFTRPDMNLSYDNVSAYRKLNALNDHSPYGMANAIRCVLSPPGVDPVGDKSRSKIIDDLLPFIAVLSNTCLKWSGAESKVADVHQTPENMAKAAMAWFDDRPIRPRVWTANATFANMEGNPVGALFDVMWDYQALVASDSTFQPWPRNLFENRIDSQMAVYRFTLDRSRRYVQSTFRTICFPTVSDDAARFDLDRTEQYNDSGKEIQQTFTCMGREVDDPITITEFNKLVAMFNPLMRIEKRRTQMVKLKAHEYPIFAHMCYPRIEDDKEFAWYAPKEVYIAVRDLRMRIANATNTGVR